MNKIRVLWVCNVPLPKIANKMGIKVPNICGWLSGFADALESYQEIELHISFPMIGLKEVQSGMIGNIHYYAFNQPKVWNILPVEDQVHVSKEMKQHIDKIIKNVQPDILHSFGTEYPHSMVAAKVFNRPERTVVNIQGLTSFCWIHYNMGIPYSEMKRFSISNVVRGNLLSQEKKMRKRGEIEIEALKNSGHVIGRTDWDKACSTQINPDTIYHFCNESLRESFYMGKWDYGSCEKYSIFMSQASYPIKGLHFMLRALPEVIRVYPDTHLYVAGNDLTKSDSIYAKLKMSSYAKYIKRLINKNKLDKYITFTGSLTEQQMKDRFLKSNVFVSPSTIENSPNSLGEAMILGVPCISSDVGGVKNLIKHEVEGFVYQADAPYMLAYYLKEMFANSKMAEELGKKAQNHARVTHDRENNIKTLINIYKTIVAE